jgi:hypothetical protein
MYWHISYKYVLKLDIALASDIYFPFHASVSTNYNIIWLILHVKGLKVPTAPKKLLHNHSNSNILALGFLQ